MSATDLQFREEITFDDAWDVIVNYEYLWHIGHIFSELTHNENNFNHRSWLVPYQFIYINVYSDMLIVTNDYDEIANLPLDGSIISDKPYVVQPLRMIYEVYRDQSIQIWPYIITFMDWAGAAIMSNAELRPDVSLLDYTIKSKIQPLFYLNESLENTMFIQYMGEIYECFGGTYTIVNEP
ncbi:MAG: hypothetical protein MUO31_07560 [Thermodesulfovibrionales bacterium]|nr:hypothetical protein [Thermodesulfovibrionales bacterium]